MLRNKFIIRNKIITKKSKTFVISEIGINHEGSFEKCVKMIQLSKKAGADAIKLQTIDPDLSYAKDTNSYKEFLKTNFENEQLFKLIKLTKKIGLIFISTPGSFEEVDKLKKFKSDAIKISSGQMTNYPLISYAAKKKLPLIISTGMAYQNEIKEALNSSGKNKNLALLKCTSLYPAPDQDINLRSIETLKKKFKCIVGFSDHTKDHVSCLAAVTMGAKIIEKHFTLNSKLKGKDHHISLEPSAFKSMVEKIRRVEKMLGTNEIGPVKNEKKNRRSYHRYIVARKIINKGEKFNKHNISIKRLKNSTSNNLEPKFYNYLLKKYSNKTIQKNDAIKKNEIKKKN